MSIEGAKSFTPKTGREAGAAPDFGVTLMLTAPNVWCMGASSTPPVVRDEPSRNHGPDLTAVGTDLVICDGEAMTYGAYRRDRGE
ncbi:hypothetical protein JCM30237_30140 [Halolamina litorea]